MSLVVIALALGSLSARALAVEITGAGQRFEVVFGANPDGEKAAGPSGRAQFEVVAVSGDRVVLDVTLTNTSDSVLWPSSRISEFGFEGGSTVTSGSLGVEESRSTRARARSRRNAENECRRDGGAQCRFGRGGGLATSKSKSIHLTLNVGPSFGTLDIDRFSVRFGRSGSSVRGVLDTTSPFITTPNTPIPEPHSIALFLAGGAPVALGVRKRVLTAR